VQAIIDRVRCDPTCSERIVTEKFPNIRDFGANSSLKDHPVKVWNDNDASSPLSRFGNCINWKKLYEWLCSFKAGSRGNHSVSVGFSSGLNTKDPCPKLIWRRRISSTTWMLYCIVTACKTLIQTSPQPRALRSFSMLVGRQLSRDFPFLAPQDLGPHS